MEPYEFVGAVASAVFGRTIDLACRRRHVDVRQFPVAEGKNEVRVRTLPSLARSRARLVAENRRRLLCLVHFAAGSGYDQPPLRPRLCAAAIDSPAKPGRNR